MKNNIGVYQIEINEKKYVGSAAISFQKRWSQHLSELRKITHSNKHLQSAFNKYGEEELHFSILESVETLENVIALEQHYIDTINPEYNMCPVAGSRLGKKHSEEARRKMSIAQRGRIISDETKIKMSIAVMGHKNALGYKHTDEARQNMSVAKQNTSDGTRQKLSIAGMGNKNGLGNKHSEETWGKMSTAAMGHKNSLGYIHTEETRKKMSIAKQNMSAETKQKISLASKKAWEIRKNKTIER